MKIYIKNRIRKKNEFQFFMHQLVENLVEKGILPLPPSGTVSTFREILLYKIESLIKRWGIKVPKKTNPRTVIITSRGANLLNESYPYWRDRIVPVLWDVWPEYHEELLRDLSILKCDTCFVTARSFAEFLSNNIGINAFWIPEGIDTKLYNQGLNLQERDIDIMEMGRQHKEFHEHVENLISKEIVKNWKGQTNNKNGNRVTLMCNTNEELYNLISNSKIFVCFPMSVTHPQKAGGIETLTQRYWEGMLSRCLLVGSAPKELIEFVGYNPVIEIDWKNVEFQLTSILNNINQYQDFVDRNYQMAIQKATWDERSQYIINTVQQLTKTIPS